jgi:phosphatidylglycerophosphate synthase
MDGAPRVVVVLDPVPGSQPADRLAAADGTSLADTVAERATAERGRAEGTCHGAADLGRLLSRDFAAPAGTDDGPLCLLDAAALALPTTYGDLVADPRAEPAVLRTADGTVVGVRLDGPLAARAPRGVEETVAAAVAGAAPGQALPELGHAVEILLAAAGVAVRDVRPGDFPLRMVGDDAALAEALAAEAGVDEEALRLRRSSRADDGFLSTFLVRPLSRRLTRRAVAHGVRPDVVTLCSGLLGLLAAAAYGLAAHGPARAWLVTGSVLLLASLVVDCVDGEVARYTRTFSPLGGWLDVGSDRLKEYAVYAGLAAGARPSAWPLAAAAFAVLVVRHFIDFGYAASVPGTRTGAADDPVGSWSQRTSRTSALLWAKRAVVMPVGERTILLAVLAPIVGARWTLGLLVVAGCVSGLYTLAGRLGRTLLAVPRGRLAWLAPAAARAVEAGGLAALVGWHRPEALPAAYLLLAAVALHQYDVVYRRRLTGSAGRPGALDRLVWPVRVIVVAALTLLLPEDALTAVLAVLGTLLLVAAGVDSVRWWRAFVRSGP